MPKEVVKTIICSVIVVLISSSMLCAEESNKDNRGEDNRGVDALGVRLPVSELLDEETRQAHGRAMEEIASLTCPGGEYPFHSEDAILVARRCNEEIALPLIVKLRERYQVDIQPERIGNVYTEVITPSKEITRKNNKRVLVNLHGGAFAVGGRVGGELESIAVAAMGKIKVVSVDYRMYPEHVFPAATDDVLAVYRELLKSYKPENIGIYGYSAGAVLTAQTLVRLQREGMPIPGAVGMLCSSAIIGDEGDSQEMVARINGKTDRDKSVSYFKNEDYDNPLISPGKYPDILMQFPPSLLVTSTRDAELSTVVVTHSRLVKLDVEARLHIYEGLGHCGYLDSQLPEFIEVHNVIVKFFDKYLGASDE